MIAYLDASAVLRRVFGETGQLREWPSVEQGVASALTEVECLRTLDHLLRQGAISAEELADRRTVVYRLLEGCDVVDVTRTILRRAAEPFPTPTASSSWATTLRGRP